MSDLVKLHRYDHGGGRLFVEKENGGRDLILDIYGDRERRDQIIAALVAAGIIPPPHIVEV